MLSALNHSFGVRPPGGAALALAPGTTMHSNSLIRGSNRGNLRRETYST